MFRSNDDAENEVNIEDDDDDDNWMKNKSKKKTFRIHRGNDSGTTPRAYTRTKCWATCAIHSAKIADEKKTPEISDKDTGDNSDNNDEDG